MKDNIKVLLTRRFLPEDIKYIRSNMLTNVDLIIPPDFDPNTIAEYAKDNVNILLGEMVDDKILKNAESLRVIQIPWTGVDRLNFELLKKYSVKVCNSHSNASIVAEYAISLMFAIAKRIPLHDKLLRKGEWNRPTPENKLFSPPDSINHKAIFFMGYGHIAQKIAKFISGFDVKFIAVTHTSKPPFQQPVDKHFLFNERYKAVKNADFVFITIPLTPKTRGIIDKNIFNSMKDTAYFINISRGEVVNEADLYEALKNNKIAGAAIDTWYKYPKPNQPNVKPSVKYPFESLDNLVLSPHRAGFLKDQLPHLDDAVENINRFASGKELINIIDLEKVY